MKNSTGFKVIALLQRVSHASVTVDREQISAIGQGLLVLLGIEKDDTFEAGQRLVRRLLDYRVFADDAGKMNRSLRDIHGELLLVSQFTLAADTKGGLRPGFSTAMPPMEAEQLYKRLLDYARQQHAHVAAGQFGADMKVALENDGPVTFMLRS